ncbi:hypothetical protein [Cryobacterium sp. PH31-L1]|uniref:hypothetical protein n=1 Tax=Cryobacterium sp. PH31-L1 TaxID=3046199 RepID=UPI0024B8DAFE|nr:hypothetical protein [Cryobacterium sp. PH31-L1]MDJ0379084.1 hypothetical protein [Cryobacterium sp. PH31-L1]
MTFVDTGEIYYDGEHLKPADYFLALRNGRRIVVDVKDPGIDTAAKTTKPLKISDAERSRLQRFADLYGAELFIAAYVSVASMWLLLPIDSFTHQSTNSHTITLGDAVAANEMSILGDLSMGVMAPLRIDVWAELDQPRTIGKDGHAEFTPGKIILSSGAGPVVTTEDKNIIMFFIQYGHWNLRQDVETIGDQLVRLSMLVEPLQDDVDQDFHIIGWLSQMYSRLFEGRTQNDLGVTALDIAVEPGALVSLIPHDFHSDDLPLWKFEVRPPQIGEGRS